MRKLVWTVSAVLALAGCGSSTESAQDTAIKAANHTKDRMCACTSADCAKQVRSDWMAQRDGLKEAIKGKPTDDFVKKMTEIETAIATCEVAMTGQP